MPFLIIIQKMPKQKNSKIPNPPILSLIILLFLLTSCLCFQFKSPQISVNPTTINTAAQYTINLQRQFTQNVTNTAWNIIAVPAGSTMTVTFPIQFVLSGWQTCDMVLIGGNIPNTFLCSIDPVQNKVTISNAIDSNQYISDVNIIISNVTNPFPALTTSSFLATIGTDYTSNDPFAAVSLSAAGFVSGAIGFNPAVVNTTGDMVVTLVNANRMPEGSTLTVVFPVNQAWAQDIAASVHKLPITPTMSCTGLSPTLTPTLTCTGNPTLQTVTITNLSPSQLPALSTIKFSINGLFSPPTQGHPDTLYVTSYIGSYQIDTIGMGVSGLAARNLGDLMIVSTGGTKPINTNIGLRVSFTLMDTVTSADYFELQFPAGSTALNSTALSSFSISTFLYSPSTLTLTFNQNIGSQTRFTNFFANITFLSYRTPNSTKPTEPIVFRVMRNGWAKMRGSFVFVADAKGYGFTVGTNDTGVNAYASYQLGVNMADALDRTGYIILHIPQELLISTLAITLTSSSPSSINPSPTLTQLNSTTYKLTNLNRTSTALNVPIQTLNLTLTGLRQPNSVRNLSAFGMEFYFSGQGYLTANGVQSNGIGIVGGGIGVTVACSTAITATMGSLSVGISLQNSVPANGYIIIAIPSEISLSSLNSTTLLSTPTSTPISFTSTQNSSTLYLRLSSLLPASSSLTLTLSPITTPISTAPSSPFQLTTTNQNNLTIDTLGAGVRLTMTQPKQIASYGVTRGSTGNYEATGYGVRVGLDFGVYGGGGNYGVLEIPVEITGNPATLAVALIASDNTTTALAFTTLSTSPIKLSIPLPPSLTTLNHTLSLTPLTNPPSLKQTSTGLILTLAYNQSSTTYLYAKSESSRIQNSQAGNFVALDYVYSTGVLFSEANLVVFLGLAVGGGVGGLSFQMDSGIGLKNTSALATCTAAQLPITCTITSTSPPILQITPSQSPTFSLTNLTLTLGLLLTPTIYSPSYPPSTLTSYDLAGYVISRNTATIKFVPSCVLPCRECVTGQPSSCMSCYTPGQNVTGLVYFVAGVGVAYGQCVAVCPSGYSSNGYLCFKCDSNCAQCVTLPTTCTACPSNLYLNPPTNTCLSTCPNSTYPSTTPSPPSCQPCPLACTLCTSPSICTYCAPSYYLYSNVCNTSCPVNITVANSGARTCDSCSINCVTCLGMVSNCTGCTVGLVLSGGVCQNSCPSTAMIVVNGTCTLCSTACLTCSVTITNCTSCNTTSTLKYLSAGQCLSACPATYYSTPSLGYLCTPCSSLALNCANCSSNGLSCLSCDPGFVFFNGTQCLGSVPNGYVNISGNATLCANTCLTCSITTTNCTSCAAPLVYYMNSCQSSCPTSTTPISNTCQPCTPPCTQCSPTPTSCTQCTTPYFLNTLTHQCVTPTSCQLYTYANTTTNICTQCNAPCLSCTTAVSCSSCIRGFYFQSVTTLCLDVCPFGWVGIVDVCVRCEAPCRGCQVSVDNCTSCVSGYYLNMYTYQCLLQCPAQLTISNPVTMTCDKCLQPCSTCENQTNLCTSCVAGTYLLGSQCMGVCTPGYYGDVVSKRCVLCGGGCLTCVNGPTQCTSCPVPKYLYNSTCVSSCPITHSIIDSSSTCRPCSTTLPYCLTCTLTGCLTCQPSTYLIEGQCYSSCPSGYVYDSATDSCITTSNNAQQQLTTTLSSSSVFPMPFTCIGLSIFIACIMSKLQNKNTYLIGAAYALSGVLETASLIFLIIKYINYNKSLQASTTEVPAITQFPLLTIGLIIIYIINLLGLVVQTPLLCSDTKFQHWLKLASHRFFFILVTLFSFLTSYKLKLVLFAKLFNFTTTRAQLQSTDKFRIFNILSFLGVSHEIFVIYMSILMITKLQNTILNNELFLVFVDVLVICFVSIVLSIVANRKDEDFFAEEMDNGYVLNKKVVVQGDDLGKEGLEAKYLKGDQNRGKGKGRDGLNQMDSFQKMLNNQREEIQVYEDEELSLSISQNRSEIDRREKQKARKRDLNQKSSSQPSEGLTKKSTKHKNNLHFAHEQTSNPINKEQSPDREEIVRHSVIFENTDKQYNEEEVVSKNQTVLLESPGKKQGKLGNRFDAGGKGNEKGDRVGGMTTGMVHGAAHGMVKGQEEQDEEIENIDLSRNNITVQTKHHTMNDTINTHAKNGQAPSEKERQRQIQKQNEKENQKQKQKQKLRQREKEKQRIRKQNETKVFYEQKDVLQQQEDIESRIKAKQDQLRSLKRQTSGKDLRRSRQKSKQKAVSVQQLISFQTKPNPPVNPNLNPLNPTNLPPKAPSTTRQKFTNIFEQDQQNIAQLHNLSETIPEVSTLIRQQREDRQGYLAQERMQDGIGEEIQGLGASLTVSKLQGDGEKGKGKDVGKLVKVSHGTVPNNSKIQQQDHIEQTYILSHSGKTKKLKTENPSIHQDPSLKSQPTDSWQQQEQPKSSPLDKNKKTIQQQLPNASEHSNKDKERDGFKKKQNIQNMYDSFINQVDSLQEGELKKSGVMGKEEQVKEEISIGSKDRVQRQKNTVDIAIGQQLEANPNPQTHPKKLNPMFDFEDEQQSMQDSGGLEDSHPGMDEEINHHPLKSSFATERRSVDVSDKASEQQRHPLIGILQAGQAGGQGRRNPVPKMEDQTGDVNREDVKTKLMKYEGKPGQDKTERKYQEKPPLQRPASTEKNRIYAAGLRQLQDQTLTKKNSYQNPLHQKSKPKPNLDEEPDHPYIPQMPNKKRNSSLYSVPLNKLDSRQSRQISSSDHTEEILIRPGYFNQNSSSQDVSFAHPKYTSTMHVDSGNEMPDKPTINITARTSFNNSNNVNRVSSTSHERGGRRGRIQQNVTAGDRMFSKKSSLEYEGEEEIGMEEGEGEGDDEDLDQFYGKIKENKGRKSPKRSKSKERNPSKQSVKRMKQLEKVYLQRLDMPYPQKKKQ